MRTIVDINSWDMVETQDGIIIVILPPSPKPRCALIALDAIYIGTNAATLRLVSSEQTREIVEKAKALIVAEADDMIRRETLVPIRITNIAFGPIGEENERNNERVAA